ncbi:hypothetical protein QJS10_CPB14g00910 [Acorus calamus]|uniref:Uncharacterized protein n=1 Tax=Acorus calamus TaxID=4465 RepID=A0AAV9DCR4_ACOCL|nr:hypothetical protein QJS10_CPB14g00910 [Acorus calamus]
MHPNQRQHAKETHDVDPELHVRHNEEHLFRPHEAKLIADKLNIIAIQKRRMEEGMIMSKGKRKLLEVAEEKKGKKKNEEEEEKRGEGGESKEMLKELRKHNNQLQQELQRVNKRMKTMKVDHSFFVHSLHKQITYMQSGFKDVKEKPIQDRLETQIEK